MSRLLGTAGMLTSGLRVLILGALLASVWVVFGAASAHALGLADSISETVEEATQAPVPAPATESAPLVPSEVPGVPESAGSDLVSAVTAPVSAATSQVAAPIESITQPVIEPIEAAAAPLTNTVTDVVAPVTNTVTDIVTPVTNTVAAVVAPVTNTVAAVVAPVTNTVTDVVAPVTNTVTDVVAPVTDTVTDVVAPVTDTVTDVVAPVTNTVTDVVAPVPSAPVSEPVAAGTAAGAGVSDGVTPAAVGVPATQAVVGENASTQAAAASIVSAVQIFDPVFDSANAQDMAQTDIARKSFSVTDGTNAGRPLASAGSADPAGNPVQPSSQGPASSGSSGSGSVLRGGGDNGFAGAAVLDSSQFSADLSGSDAVFARSADMPGPIASEHGFSPD